MRYFIVCLFLSLFIFSCDSTSKITLTKLEGSPAYENAKLEIDTIAFKEEEYSFKFNVLDYNLGEQTEKEFNFDKPLNDRLANQRIIYEPKGVCALITPWNWPMNQVCLKVIPALASGCTMVLKPSEIAPLSSMILAEIIDEVRFPKGVFNLVNGDGATTGEALSLSLIHI